MICFPNAKINVGLSIESKRFDGLHNLNSCLIPIPLFDILEIRKAENYSLEVYGTVTGIDAKNNIINTAWNLIKNYCPENVEVLLFKNIPIGSGLGGGSSDAVFFLKEALNLFDVIIPEEQLSKLAFKLGADCPFFINNKPSLIEGAGERLKEINNPVSGSYLTVVYPEIEISTADSFSKVQDFSKINYPEVLKLDKHSWKEKLPNTFQKKIVELFPEIQEIINILYKKGAYYASLSGTGSSVFALSHEKINISEIPYWNFYSIL